ncbi:acetyl-coenzyme A synthetase N-terminal domain-containing protein, partial [Nocardia goodfellowii]
MTSATDHATAAFEPTAEFTAAANAGAALYDSAATDRLEFWAEQARRLHWHQRWSQVLDWTDAPVAKWFVDGKLNVAY